MSKTILITGSSTGLGKLAAFELARRGHHVIASAHTWSGVTNLKREAEAHALTIQAEKLDITSAFDRSNALKWDIDILVSNAGIMECGPIAEQPIELLRSMFDVNFFFNLELVQGFVKKMVAKRRGKIVFNSSVAGLMVAPFGAGYCASKHALEAVAEGLRVELAPLGIKVAIVNPGPFSTGFNDRGADSALRWYDPKTNFTPPEVFAYLSGVLANQFDPQSMADVIVDVVLSDDARFRNVHPKQLEGTIMQLQQDAWHAQS